jgi:hypothetical protein
MRGYTPPPLKWREPLPSRKRCPKCRSRMRVSVALSECPYCGYLDRSAPLERTTDPGPYGDTPAGLEYRVEESIAEAEGLRSAEHHQFVSFELPRENNAERVFAVGLLILALFLHIPASRRAPDIFDFANPDQALYIGIVTIGLALLAAAAAGMTFVGLRRLAVPLAAVAALSCLADAAGLLPFGALQPLSVLVLPAYAHVVIAAQGLAFAWLAAFIHRDTRDLQVL